MSLEIFHSLLSLTMSIKLKAIFLCVVGCWKFLVGMLSINAMQRECDKERHHFFFVSVTEALIESGEVEDINGSGSMYM